jgi:hypothetical protein
VNLTDAFNQEIKSNKKVAELDWREWTEHLERTQELYAKAAQTQTFAEITLPGERPVCILPWSDLHWGGSGVDYKIFRTTTDEILATPDLYVALVGDLVEFAIKLRSVAEICAQIVGPDKQVQFLENWLDEIKPKLILATFGNHDFDRSEAAEGFSIVKKMLAHRTICFSGIGHADIRVGEQVYKMAISHKFRGFSYLNPTHAGARYLRMQGIDREIAIQGDIHQPAFSQYYDGPVKRVSMVAGTLNVQSTYAQRYFSIFTQPYYPVLELHNKQHLFTPFENLQSWKLHQAR